MKNTRQYKNYRLAETLSFMFPDIWRNVLFLDFLLFVPEGFRRNRREFALPAKRKLI